MDIWPKEKRSKVMSKIRSKNTKPEKMLRTALHTAGYRFRIHIKDLPGKPDIVLPKYKLILYVHGCFWHFHADCQEGRIPKTNYKFWKKKLSKTIERDALHQKICKDLGWNVLIIWECEIEKNIEKVLMKLKKNFLDFQPIKHSNLQVAH